MTRPPTETASTHTLHPSPTLFRSHRAGRHHRDALHFRLAVERLLRIFGAHVLLAFIEHLDVAAERNRRDLVFGTVAPEPAPQRCAKADREAQYLDPEPACDPEMNEFVERSEERSVGKACVSNSNSRCGPYHSKKKKTIYNNIN